MWGEKTYENSFGQKVNISQGFLGGTGSDGRNYTQNGGGYKDVWGTQYRESWFYDPSLSQKDTPIYSGSSSPSLSDEDVKAIGKFLWKGICLLGKGIKLANDGVYLPVKYLVDKKRGKNDKNGLIAGIITGSLYATGILAYSESVEAERRMKATYPAISLYMDSNGVLSSGLNADYQKAQSIAYATCSNYTKAWLNVCSHVATMAASKPGCIAIAKDLSKNNAYSFNIIGLNGNNNLAYKRSTCDFLTSLGHKGECRLAPTVYYCNSGEMNSLKEKFSKNDQEPLTDAAGTLSNNTLPMTLKATAQPSSTAITKVPERKIEHTDLAAAPPVTKPGPEKAASSQTPALSQKSANSLAVTLRAHGVRSDGFYAVEPEQLNLRQGPGMDQPTIAQLFAKSCIMRSGTARHAGFIPVVTVNHESQKIVSGWISEKHLKPLHGQRDVTTCTAQFAPK
jgi:hypothetical protein